MNSTRIQDSQPKETGLISDEAFITVDQALAYLMLMVSLVGIVTNVINIRTFIAMGLQDGVSISLLGLSISDLGATSCSGVLSASLIVGTFEKSYNLQNLPIHPSVFIMFSANVSLIFFHITCLTTTFLAVARCMCVAMPFKFKDTFTRSRSIFAQVVFSIVGMTMYFPVISQMGTRNNFDPTVNGTRVVLWLSKMRSEIKDVVSLIHNVLAIFVSTFVVFICVLIMAKYLRQSVKFRNVSSAKTGNDEKDTSDDKLSGKELQVVKQVVVISAIYTACMLPYIFFTLYKMGNHDFDVGRRLHNFYLIVSSILVNLNIINSSTTFPVYYVFNSKFRSLLCFNSKANK